MVQMFYVKSFYLPSPIIYSFQRYTITEHLVRIKVKCCFTVVIFLLSFTNHRSTIHHLDKLLSRVRAVVIFYKQILLIKKGKRVLHHITIWILGNKLKVKKIRQIKESAQSNCNWSITEIEGGYSRITGSGN